MTVSRSCTRLPEPGDEQIAEVVAILERSGAQDFTRAEAQRYRDECLAELDALTVVEPEAREKLKGIIVGVISA